jgi:glycosyltransferase involved in cell wall biosynthesis
MLQIICVDDGSVDESKKVLDVWAQRDSRIEVISQSHAGVVQARKTGILLAKGLYTVWVDADDWIEESYIENLMHARQKMGVDVICASHTLENGARSSIVRNELLVGRYKVPDIVDSLLSMGEFYHFGISQYLWAKLFPTQLLRKYQLEVPNEINAGDDVAVVYLTILEAGEIGVMEEVGYHYVQHSTSICHTLDKSEREKCKNLVEYLRRKCSESQYHDVLKKQVQQYEKLLFLSRDIGIFDNGNDAILIPFGGVNPSSKVIIYGAGSIGRSVAKYVLQHTDLDLVGWVDQTEQFSWGRQENRVLSPNQFNWTLPFDVVLIAILNQTHIEEIKEQFRDRKITESKIRCLTQAFRDEKVSMKIHTAM